MSRFEKSSNPAMKQFTNPSYDYNANVLDAPINSVADGVMTLSGTINKTFLLLAILIVSAVVSAFVFPSQTVMYVGLGGAFIIAIVISFKPTMAPILSPVYAIFEGMFLGLVSTYYAARVGDPNIIFYAVGLTISTFAAMLMIYKSGLIPVTKKLRMIITAATMGIMFMYIMAFVMSMFFGVSATYLHDGSWLAIGLSVLIIGVAAFNFLLDFDTIEKGVQGQAPKYMEWYGGFALLVTLAWLYFEFLRLLSMLMGRD
ncbi:MAG: putative YccA/Bax inhibitor family protein [Maribacter sp.]|jgi:uncharacterized YccA/Bax inhibitor family protein